MGWGQIDFKRVIELMLTNHTETETKMVDILQVTN